MNYIKIPKKLLLLTKENKYVTMAYAYIYSQKNYHGVCYSSINMMSHILRHKVSNNKTESVCYNFATALRFLQDKKFINDITDRYFQNLATNFGKKENSDFNYEKISMWSLNEDSEINNDSGNNENNEDSGDNRDGKNNKDISGTEKDCSNNIYSNGFILIEYEKFMEVSLLYLPDVLNVYLYIISRINRNISNGYCSTSINTMMGDLGISRNSIIKNVGILKELGYITDENGEHASGNGNGNGNGNKGESKRVRKSSNKYWLCE